MLDTLLDSHEDWQSLFAAFSRERMPNAAAIAQMALENYTEMRAHRPGFQIRPSATAGARAGAEIPAAVHPALRDGDVSPRDSVQRGAEARGRAGENSGRARRRLTRHRPARSVDGRAPDQRAADADLTPPYCGRPGAWRCLRSSTRNVARILIALIGGVACPPESHSTARHPARETACLRRRQPPHASDRCDRAYGIVRR